MISKIRFLFSLLVLPAGFFLVQYVFIELNPPAMVDDLPITQHSSEQFWWGLFHDRENPPAQNKVQVLLIGDSIASGYRRGVSRRLSDIAYVDSWITPLGEHEEATLPDLQRILSVRRYDIIHFNTGLHGLGLTADETLMYVQRYLKVLQQYAPHAMLIWASITPVTVNGDKYTLDPVMNPILVEKNIRIARLMQENGVIFNDLYSLMIDHLGLGRGDRFHWQSNGSALMAEQVEVVIRENVKSVVNGSPFSWGAPYYFMSGVFTVLLALLIAGLWRKAG